ncbi:MAG: hypothetical protein NVS3B3_20070 [Aquirhabdus sp.]
MQHRSAKQLPHFTYGTPDSTFPTLAVAATMYFHVHGVVAVENQLLHFNGEVSLVVKLNHLETGATCIIVKEEDQALLEQFLAADCAYSELDLTEQVKVDASVIRSNQFLVNAFVRGELKA